MKRYILAGIILLLSHHSLSQDVISACEKFNAFTADVFLKGRVNKAEAQRQFKALVGELNKTVFTSSGGNLPSQWAFPLKGYKAAAIGGTRGNGYSDKGFSYLDGNKHTAHPAHDIFIKDKNQDNLDDITGKPVGVLAIDDGYVIACTNQWDSTSSLKGGRFIWLYHPATSVLSYYAHNRQIFVRPGDRIKQGQKIAEVGRTGLNAFKKRSPTHLHFSTFTLKEYVPVPFNGYNNLVKAITQ